MKRLNCLYENRKDKKYPWLLKHPKIKDGLAKFKTRQEAIDWFLSLDLEVALWFQNDKKIFDGQLTSDFDEGKFSYFIKTNGFDGGATYEQCCKEFSINPSQFTRSKFAAHERLRDLDYVQISDPKTYFPPELEIAKATNKKEVVDVEALKSSYQEQINLLLTQMDDQSKEAQKSMDELKQEINKKDINVIEMKKSMERLQNNMKVSEGLHYCRYINLAVDEFVGAFGLYVEKLNSIKNSIYGKKISSKDYALITNNFDSAEKEISAIESMEDFQYHKTIVKLHKEFLKAKSEILTKINEDPTTNDSTLHRAYVQDAKKGIYTPLSWETSYIIMNLKHIGFVEYSDYKYTISYLAQNVVNKFMVLTDDEEEKEEDMSKKKEEKVELKEEIIVEPMSEPIKNEVKPEPQVQAQPIVNEIPKQEEVKIVIAEKPAEPIKPNNALDTIVNPMNVPVINQVAPPMILPQSNIMAYNTTMMPAPAPAVLTPATTIEDEQGPDKTNLYRILSIVFGLCTLTFVILIIMACLQIFANVVIFKF